MDNMIEEFDAIVIGSGGGSKLVKPVSKLGKKVALIEKDRLGGTCLNRGCIPSKMLIHAADVALQVREAEKFDLRVPGELTVHFNRLISRVAATIDAESDAIAPSHEKELIRGEAKFVGEKLIAVGNRVLTAERIFIAVGAKPYIPPIPGLQGTPFMTYAEALRPSKRPSRLLILGGGYIAVELGHFYSAMGVETHFFVRSGLVRSEDGEIREIFEREFDKRNLVYYGREMRSVSYAGGEFTVTDQEGGAVEGDALLIATGITPETDSLDLSKTGIFPDKKGFIPVNEYLETSCRGIWAFGDCIGRHLFRHSANFEGEYLYEQLFKKQIREPIAYPAVPHAVFSHPQIGAVGPTEEELQTAGIPYIVGRGEYRKTGMGKALLDDHGLVKLLFDARTRKLLGAHAVGLEASNLIHMPIAYLQMGATVDDLVETIYIHPALPEVIRNAARQAFAQFALEPLSRLAPR